MTDSKAGAGIVPESKKGLKYDSCLIGGMSDSSQWSRLGQFENKINNVYWITTQSKQNNGKDKQICAEKFQIVYEEFFP